MRLVRRPAQPVIRARSPTAGGGISSADATHQRLRPTDRTHSAGEVSGSSVSPLRALPNVGKTDITDRYAYSKRRATGAALGWRLRVAQSSGQVIDHVIRDQCAEPLRAVSKPNIQTERPPLPDSDGQSRQSANRPNWASGGTCPESDRWLHVRYTRSWAAVFFEETRRDPFLEVEHQKHKVAREPLTDEEPV
jgi:hypothetical protein